MEQNEIGFRLKNFQDAISFIKTNNLSVPQIYTFDLATARTDLEISITGNFVYIIDSNDSGDQIDVKFNAQHNQPFPLVRQLGIRTPFTKVFLTNTAQPSGEVKIVIGSIDADFMDIVDNRSATSLSLDAIRDELRGNTTAGNYDQVAVTTTQGIIVASNANRKSVLVQADPTNTGTIYLGFDSGVLSTKSLIALSPGAVWSIDDYRGAVHAIASAVSQNIYYGESV